MWLADRAYLVIQLFVILHTFAFGTQNLRNTTRINKMTPSIALKIHNHTIYTRRFGSYCQVSAFERSCAFSAVCVFLRRKDKRAFNKMAETKFVDLDDTVKQPQSTTKVTTLCCESCDIVKDQLIQVFEELKSARTIIELLQEDITKLNAAVSNYELLVS